MKLISTIRLILSYGFVLLASFCPLNSFALSETLSKETTRVYTFKQLGWDDSITLNGYKPSHTFYLPISEHTNPQKAILHLKIVFAPLLGQETSLEIKFNQVSIGHLDMALDKEKIWDIELPLTQLTPNWQDLNFSAYLVSTKNLCNPNIWIYISPESTLTLTTQQKLFKSSLNQLPFPFVNPASIDPTPVLLLLPKAFTQQELVNLLQVAWKLGSLAGDSKINFSLDFINDSLDKQKDNNVILVGTSKDLFKESGLQLDTYNKEKEITQALSDSSGILLLNASPFNPFYGLLAITGMDEQGLNKAVSAFLTPEFKTLGSGHLAIIDEVQVPQEEKVSGERYLSTLKELNYADQSVTGLGQHTVTYNIPLPRDKVPNYGQVKTYITVPAFPTKNSSQMTLSVNGVKQSSFWLNKEHEIWQTVLNAEALKPGINRLDFLISLHLEPENCNKQDYDQVWATIYSQTQFAATFSGEFPSAMLNQLPVPFGSEINFVLPDTLSKERLKDLTLLFYKLGKLFQPYKTQFNIFSSKQINEDFIHNNNVILIGTPDDNPWVKFALDFMPFQLKGNSRLLKLQEEKLKVSGSNITGLLELMPSPWSEGYGVLIISGDKEEGLSLAINALIKDKKRMSLNGNIALINQDHSLEVYNSYDNRYISFKHRVLMYTSNLGRNLVYYFKNHPQIFIYILVIIVPLVILLRRRRK